MRFIYFLEIINSLILDIADPTNSTEKNIEYVSHPFFSKISLILIICICLGAVIYAYKPALINPVGNVRMSMHDKVDSPIRLLIINGFGFSFITFFMPTFIPILAQELVQEFVQGNLLPVFLMLALILLLFALVYALGAYIGLLVEALFRGFFLLVVRRHRYLEPWITMRKLCCQKCTKPLHLIASSRGSSELLLNYLSPIEQVAARDGTKFAIWHCSYCYPVVNRDSVNLRGYRRADAVICPRCQETTMRISSSYRTFTSDAENEVTTYICEYCSAETSHTRLIQGGHLD